MARLRTREASTKEKKSSKPESISVVVADNHPLTLRGMTSIFGEEGGISIVAEVANRDEAIEAIRRHEPDIAVLSLDLPDKGALGVLEAVVQRKLKTRPVILATSINEESFLQAKSLGVRGVVLKDMPLSSLVQCVHIVHRGGEFIEKNTLMRALGSMMRRETARSPLTSLTSRERAVADKVLSGMSNKDIARQLGLTEGTVKSHLHRVYQKLQVKGRFALINLGRWRGLE
jgi:DNA-binding NarL/FixJ family response regulator